MFELLNNIQIVLVETSHPGNIGAAARAMKTMGLSQLKLVNPLSYPCAEATARASSANDLLANAKVFSSLENALADTVLVIGTSARERRLQWPEYDPAEVARLLLQEAQQAKVALVFGREKWGLTNEELAHCGAVVTINANPEYSSLNLASAVQIMSYELRRGLLAQQTADSDRTVVSDDEAPATTGEMEGLYGHLEQTLADIGVTSGNKPKDMLLRRLRRLFNRARLSTTEVNILRGIFSAAQGKKQVRSSKQQN